MRTRIIVGSLLFMALVLIIPPVTAQAPQDKTVVPASRVGPWGLDMPLEKFIGMNGTPSARPSIASQYVSRATWYPWGHLGVAAASHDKRLVEFIAVFDTQELSTRHGIRIKSSRRHVEVAYGEPQIESDISVDGKIITALIYDKRGLAVFLERDSVQMIVIFRPGDGGILSSACGS